MEAGTLKGYDVRSSRGLYSTHKNFRITHFIFLFYILYNLIGDNLTDSLGISLTDSLGIRLHAPRAMVKTPPQAGGNFWQICP